MEISTSDNENLLPAPVSWFDFDNNSHALSTLINEDVYCSQDNGNPSSSNTNDQFLRGDDMGTVDDDEQNNDCENKINEQKHELNQTKNVMTSMQRYTNADCKTCYLNSSEEKDDRNNNDDDHHHHHHNPITTSQAVRNQRVGAPSPSPSWKEISSQVLPAAARELLSSSFNRVFHTARWSYAVTTKWQNQYCELGNPARGYYKTTATLNNNDKRMMMMMTVIDDNQPPFSSLPWIERQMVKEWRTFHYSAGTRKRAIKAIQHQEGRLQEMGRKQQQQPVDVGMETSSVFTVRSHCEEIKKHGEEKVPSADETEDEDDDDFERARILIPPTMPRPTWQHADVCFTCYKPFGPTLLRHHCRLCGHSFCQTHSSNSHDLPHLGYQVAERVCDECKTNLAKFDLIERNAWRLARCRDFREDSLCPYFELGVDTIQDVAIRITNAAIAMAKSVPLGAQATVAVETLEVLRRHGLNGIYTVLLRQEFLAAANMLQKALGINRTSWPLSVHELSAAIFYALAQHRALRGLNPEREHEIHALSTGIPSATITNSLLATAEEEESNAFCGGDDEEEAKKRQLVKHQTGRTSRCETQGEFTPVCEAIPDSTINALIFFAPLALNFIYSQKEVDMQLLAAQQGWRLLYTYLHQEGPQRENKVPDRPASALFVHKKHRMACLAIRGTSTIHDVITDIRQNPVPFPEPHVRKTLDNDWTTISKAPGLAVSGMASAAMNLYQEHVDSLIYLAKEGYRIRLVGHSLGGGVATLLGALLHHEFPAMKLPVGVTCSREDQYPLRVYSYGTPACIDANLSDSVESFVVTAVLHDDVVPRLSPSSCRGLLKHLLVVRDTWMNQNLPNDIMAITERAKLAWAPRWREGCTLLPSAPSSSSIKRYCQKQYYFGKKKFISMKNKLMEVADDHLSVSKKLVGEWEKDSEVTFTETKEKTETSLPEDANETEKKIAAEECTLEPCLLVDFMGGACLDQATSGIVIDGEEFFEAGGASLVEEEHSDDACFEDAVEEIIEQRTQEQSKAVKDITNSASADKDLTHSDSETPEAVVLAETPLPRLYVPGKIVHIYSHRGCYRAVYVPRSFRELRRITMAGNMLADHTCKAYYEALLEVRTVRIAQENPPKWVAFDEDDTCSCCASRFTWASTSSSEAQEARDKHNCRSCGTLVCDPCSKNRIPLPSIGLTCAVRVCDRCYHDIDNIPNSKMDHISASTTKCAYIDTKPERSRERRSEVVDDLASRIAAPTALF